MSKLHIFFYHFAKLVNIYFYYETKKDESSYYPRSTLVVKTTQINKKSTENKFLNLRKTHLFQCEIRRTQRLLYFLFRSCGCLNGRSKTVQDSFERKFFHVASSYFPLFTLFLINDDRFFRCTFVARNVCKFGFSKPLSLNFVIVLRFVFFSVF